MADRIDARTVVAALLGVAALAGLAWFARTVAPDLSVTVQSAVIGLLALLALTAAATLRYQQGLTYLFAAMFVGFAGYALSTHRVGYVGVVVAVLVTLGAVFGAVYLVVERQFKLRPREVAVVLVVVALVGGALVAADLRTDPVTYETDLHETAQVPGDSEMVESVVVGTATARNTFVFREQLAFPSARACVYNGTARASSPVLYGTNGSYFPASVGGNSEFGTEMTVLVSPDTSESTNGTVPVERAATCPETSDDARVVVVVSE
ncbi:hypothetical protein [Halosimplex salinum]|uniref:hypothetical protein n=1 Tax=Halosimplex salinum TaxID=1710538 RepID=UPI000F492909|nr:hypothetical protein [Halosimplex salinum]